MNEPVRTIGIELGGTKALAVLAEGARIVARSRVPTATPDATLDALVERAAEWLAERPVAALGIASFGPVDLDPTSAGYGRITTTPKPGWQGADVRARFAARLALPIGLDTDVAGAALAEHRWGAAQGCGVAVYVTVGTGIGGGVVVDGRSVRGLRHPEFGHVRVRRLPGDAFAGICPAHGDCLEGLASGPAIRSRSGVRAADLPPGDPAWSFVADALAEAMAMLLLTLSPQRIVVGGGVAMGTPWLLPRVRAATAEKLAGYLDGIDAITLAGVIVPPALGDDAGPLGAVALALDAYQAASNASAPPAAGANPAA